MNAYFILILMIVFISVLVENHMHKIRMERISNYMPKVTIDDEEFNLNEYGKTRDEFIKYIKDELLLSTMPIVVTEDTFWGDYQLNKLKELTKNPKYKD